MNGALDPQGAAHQIDVLTAEPHQLAPAQTAPGSEEHQGPKTGSDGIGEHCHFGDAGDRALRCVLDAGACDLTGVADEDLVSDRGAQHGSEEAVRLRCGRGTWSARALEPSVPGTNL